MGLSSERYREEKMLILDEAYIAKINARMGGGRILKAAILTETKTPLVKRYFVDNEEPITFGGNIYQPLHMVWSGMKANAGMQLDGMAVTVSNLGGLVESYAYRLDISGNDVELQILHEDLLSTLVNFKSLRFKVLTVSAEDAAVTFQIGRTWGFDDRCAVMLKSEFPSLLDDVGRVLN